MQGMRSAAFHRARRRHQRLPHHLAAEHAFAAQIAGLAAKEIDLQRFEIELPDQVCEGGVHRIIVVQMLTAGDFQRKGNVALTIRHPTAAETSMRTRMLGVVYLILAACAGSEPPPTLSIQPSGNQTVTGPTTVTASPDSLANDITWSLNGPGSISGTKGISVVYRPPVPATGASATLTATTPGQTATVTFTSQTPAQPQHAIAGLTANVDVTYDQYDIPHIFCAAQADCYAAQGYIQAQDRLFQMDLFRRTARGRLAALVGPTVASQDQLFLTLFITRDGKRIEDVLVQNLDATTKAKLQAYTNGVNAYLAFLKQNVTLMPGEYAQLPGPPRPTTSPTGS